MEVLIIGGGAAGMMAAVSAASMGAYVTVFEKEDMLGKKLLRTGNGRCNLSNRDLRTDFYHSNDNELLDNYFSKFDEDDTVRTFRSLGLIIKESGGYMYPFCEQAKVVRDVLLNALSSYNVNIEYGTVADKIVKRGTDNFEVTVKDRVRTFNRIILACGSYAGIEKKDRMSSDRDGYSLAYSLGHTIIPVKPALCGLSCHGDFWRDISGVRTDAMVTLISDGALMGSEYGELQFTDTGLSGIPIMQLSHYVGAFPDMKHSLQIDLLPGMNEDEYISLMQGRMLQFAGSSVDTFMKGTLNSKLCEYLIKTAGLEPEDEVCDATEDRIIDLVGMIRCFNVSVRGTRDFTHAQCCSGGVPLREIDDDCRSVKTPGLYICGEMLDVDGACGGYNLQWAWTTGYIAGRAAGCY